MSVGGIAAWAAGARSVADAFWAATTALLLVPLTISVVRSLLRRDVGVDAIALVSMAGALALGEYLAGAVVALMLAGGNALEERANRRAARELTALVERAPRTALAAAGRAACRGAGGGRRARRPCASSARARSSRSTGWSRARRRCVDESALTGEPLPVTVGRGGQVRSGTSSAGAAFELRALRPAAESAYAALVRLVEQAGSERAPFVRIADRYAAIFLPVTAVVAGVAWAVSGDPVRALAVFVVATPCPLILAAPIALMLGALPLRARRRRRQGRRDDRAARQGALGAARQDGHDHARPSRARSRSCRSTGSPPAETLRLAASVDRLSAHPLAKALVAGAEARGLSLERPERVVESFGRGIEGRRRTAAMCSSAAVSWLAEHGVEASLPAGSMTTRRCSSPSTAPRPASR